MVQSVQINECIGPATRIMEFTHKFMRDLEINIRNFPIFLS